VISDRLIFSILRITSVDHEPSSTTATIHFEKASAAKTALMLNGGSLDGSHLEVTSDAFSDSVDHDEHGDPTHIDQSDKPKAGSE